MNQAIFDSAVAALQAGNPQKAEELCRMLLASSPRNFNTLHLLGMTQFQLGRLLPAIETIKAALAINPAFAPAWSNLGMIQSIAEQPQDALASYERAFRLAPPGPELLVNAGNTLVTLGRAEEAKRNFDRALGLRPNMVEALIGRAKVHREQGAPARSLADSERALAVLPASSQALCDRGIALTELARFDEALASFDAALKIRPDFAEAAFSKAMLLLLLGDFAAGLPLYEARKRLKPPSGLRPYPQPHWRGQPLTGKHIFVYCEQGLGDTIMFSRFVGPLLAMGAAVSLAVPKSLQALFRGFTPKLEIIAAEDAPGTFDFHAPLASLPLALGLRAETIPAKTPYLEPEADRVEKWRARIGQQGMRIGICWQGARTQTDIGRSFHVSLFAPIAAIPGVRLISLQKNLGVEQLQSLPPGMRVEQLGEAFDAGPDAFLDSAAVMAALDLVITSDTAIAHLAGALDRPVWIALRHVPEWRWLLGRSDCPWYPSATLFRQSALNDWSTVFDAMAAKLKARGAGPAP